MVSVRLCLDPVDFVIANKLGAIVLDDRIFIMANGLAAIMPNPVAFIVFHLNALILFGMQPDFFRAFFIFKAQRIGVGRATALARTRQNPGLSLVGGQIPWRHVALVV